MIQDLQLLAVFAIVSFGAGLLLLCAVDLALAWDRRRRLRRGVPAHLDTEPSAAPGPPTE